MVLPACYDDPNTGWPVKMNLDSFFFPKIFLIFPFSIHHGPFLTKVHKGFIHNKTSQGMQCFRTNHFSIKVIIPNNTYSLLAKCNSFWSLLSNKSLGVADLISMKHSFPHNVNMR